MILRRSIVIFLFVGFTSLMAQTKASLGEKEIQGSKRIEFINRTTVRASTDIREENSSLGKKLAKGASTAAGATVDGINVKRIQPSADGKLGADIITLGDSNSYDHINSVARIIESYVEAGFQYKAGGSSTLAQYALYYNAAHRKDLKFFAGKYSEEVIKSLTADKVGIDLNYRNWPGKTQIVIPIESNILKDGGKDVTTDELEKEVNKIVQEKEKDTVIKQKMTEEAKKMDTLQTKKIVEEKKIVQEKKQEIAKEEKKIEQKKEELKKKESETVASLNELKKDPTKNKDAIQKKEEELGGIKQEQKVVEDKAAATQGKKEELDKKEEQLAAKEEARKEGATTDGKATDPGAKDASATATTATTETTTVAEVKKAEEKAAVAEQKVEKLEKEIAVVKEELKKKEEQSDNVVNNKIIFLKFIKYDSDGHYSNELWAIDTTKDDALFKSPYNNICSKDFREVPNQGILVLGYDGDKVETRKHKLVILDPDKLSVKKTSEAADIFWRTPMIYRDDLIYVIEKFKDKYHVTRFKPDLTLDIRSSDDVEENSEITFFKDKVYVTGKPKEGDKTTIRIFKKDDLTLIKTIAP